MQILKEVQARLGTVPSLSSWMLKEGLMFLEAENEIIVRILLLV